VWGVTSLVQRKGEVFIQIEINVNLDPVGRLLVLYHEYAHAMSWGGPDQEAAQHLDHPPEWGLAEARLWSYASDNFKQAPQRPF
jgi:hypothetical protein